jgi:hypothetical protein
MARHPRPKTDDPLAAGPIPIKGASPGVVQVTASDWRKQSECRAAMAALAIAGVPKGKIREVIAQKYGVADAVEFDRLMRRALDDHQREREDLEPYNKAHAEQRLLETIAKAREAGQFGPAVKGEEVLAKIQGTEKLRVNVDVSLVLQENLLGVLNGMTEEQVREMVADRARKLGVPNPLALEPAPARAVVDTTLEELDEF